VYVKRVIVLPLVPVRDTGKEVETQVSVRKQGNTLGACQFGREDQANIRVQRARRIRTFDSQYIQESKNTGLCANKRVTTFTLGDS